MSPASAGPAGRPSYVGIASVVTPMRILVTGGSGFLGAAFVRTARAAGHRLAVLSRAAPGEDTAGVTWLTGSVAEPPGDAIARFAPEACVHAAWIATPGVYLESPENDHWVRWSLDFLDRLSSLGVRHFTVLGTCIEYRITGRPLREETTPLAPVSPYARGKHALHERLREHWRDRQHGLAWARIFYPYGEGEHPARLASSIIQRLKRGEAVQLKTPGSVKDYIQAEDVARALLTVVESGFDGPINVGTGEGVAVETIARRLAELLGRPELVRVPAQPVADPLDYVVADATRLRGLGWSPQVTLAAGLRRLVEARGR